MFRVLTDNFARPLCPFALLCAALLVGQTWAQSTKPPMQPLRLPDPTPRDLDPRLIYGTDAGNTNSARQAMTKAAVKEQQHVLLVAEMNEILVLAQQLCQQQEHPGTAPSAPPEIMTMQKIEKLARSVKEQMKMQ